MKTVYTTTSLAEVYGARSLLEAHGIESVVVNEGGAFLVIGMPSPALPLGLAVPDDQAEAAARLLAQGRRIEPPTPDEAAFAESVRRSDRVCRRGWLAALWIMVLGPFVLAGPALGAAYGVSAIVSTIVMVGALFAVPLAVILAAGLRPKT